MKWLLSAFFILFSVQAMAYKGQLAVRGGSWSFATENVTSTNESNSGIGAYAVEIGYSPLPKLLAVFGINMLLSDIYTGSAGYGFDIGAKYFPISETGTITSESSQGQISIQEKWRPYVGFFMRQRIFSLAISTSYMGPGLTAGLDYAMGDRWFLSGELRYDYLYGRGDALAQQTNILMGIGTQF